MMQSGRMFYTRAAAVFPAVVILAASAGLAAEAPAAKPMLLPRPVKLQDQQGFLSIKPPMQILVQSEDPGFLDAGKELSDILQRLTDETLPVKTAKANAGSMSGGFVFTGNSAPDEVGEEGYTLDIRPAGVVIRARKAAGAFYAVQTLRQIAETMSLGGSDPRQLPAMRVVDYPRFAWRGLMQDCSRTFLSVAELKRHIDALAMYKLNVFHLHLTDDQGWRVEIRKHPRLTEVGSRFDPAFKDEKNGFYSQAEIRDLVEYAARRHVTLVPEIEMPSHCLAVLKAYPELSCRGDKYVIAPFLHMADGNPGKQPATPYGVLCAGNDRAFELMRDVLDEVIELFPSRYIHIGGDECPKDFWKNCPKCQARIRQEQLKDEFELQSYFIKRIERHIVSRSRVLIGWDEILEGGLAPQATVMSWRGVEGGIAAARQGHDVVMSPTTHCYFDYSYLITPTRKVYEFEPVPKELTPEQGRHILGAQANMWTHIVRTDSGIERMVFPRLLALAEVVWSPADGRDWAEFEPRLKAHEGVLGKAGLAVEKRPDAQSDLQSIHAGADGSVWLIEGSRVYRWTAEGWKELGGNAREVAAGPKGTIWAVGINPCPGGYELFEWRDGAFKTMGNGAAAVSIAASPDGSLWAANDGGRLFRYADGAWKPLPGGGHRVTVSPEGAAWAVMDSFDPEHCPVAQMDGEQWVNVTTCDSQDRLVAGKNGVLYASGRGGLRVWREGRWSDMPGDARSLAVTPAGTLIALPQVSMARPPLKMWDGQAWQEYRNNHVK